MAFFLLLPQIIMIVSMRFLPVICAVLLFSCAPSSLDSPAPLDPPEPTTTETTDTPPESVPPAAIEQGQVLPITATATIQSTGKVFDLEVTRTAEERSIGLMYREELADDRGMLFEFDPPRPVSFWMKNCRMNLDMIFMQNGIVQAIARDVPPCDTEPCPTYGTPIAIDQVIEIRGGLADEINLQEGDKIIVDHFVP